MKKWSEYHIRRVNRDKQTSLPWIAAHLRYKNMKTETENLSKTLLQHD